MRLAGGRDFGEGEGQAGQSDDRQGQATEGTAAVVVLGLLGVGLRRRNSRLACVQDLTGSGRESLRQLCLLGIRDGLRMKAGSVTLPLRLDFFRSRSGCRVKGSGHGYGGSGHRRRSDTCVPVCSCCNLWGSDGPCSRHCLTPVLAPPD